ncbi:hypothetical protein J3B02_000489 [Coemansia erecta]|nr:hypothetical protein J3B02_000489 [Coemansia erecta]
MQIFATLLIAASAVLAQQIGSNSDGKASTGPSAVSHPNENNGWQAQNSLFNNANTGGNVFSGLHGNTFDSSVSNTAFNDNNAVNPSQAQVSGNSGDTANGVNNHIGNVVPGASQIAPFAGTYPGFRKRDVEFNNVFPGHVHAHEEFVPLGYPAVAGFAGYPHAAAAAAVVDPHFYGY